MNRNKKLQGMCLFVSIVLICYFAVKVIQFLDNKKIQKVAGFIWPKGTKELQRKCSFMQGAWVKVHLQLPYAVMFNTNQYSRFDFAYCGEFDPKTMNIYRWEKQRSMWRSQKGSAFEMMKKKPIAGTNLLFAESHRFENMPWEIIYDEQTRQMWIHCF